MSPERASAATPRQTAFQTSTPVSLGSQHRNHNLSICPVRKPTAPLRKRTSSHRAHATRPRMQEASGGGPESGEPQEQQQQPDIIERLWNAIFGAKEAEPFGLKRFDRDRFPELYPATLDEFADPVDSDDAEMASFRPMLARTQLQTRALQLVYDSSQHGWTSAAFHERVDRLGAAVVLCRTAGGAVCGGYNPKGFVGYGESRGSKAAFLFTWPDGDNQAKGGRRAIKLRKVGGAALAVVDEPECGPSFGADALVIPLMPPRAEWEEDNPRNRIARSKLGSYYERRPDGGNCLFADGESGKGTPLEWMHIYTGVYAEGEEIPFNDALPFSLE